MDWLLLQLADASLPTGGFAHSAGLETCVQGGVVRGEDDLRRFLDDALWGAAHGALPFVTAAFDDFVAADRACDAFLTSTVSNRASRTQGRAFIETCARVFPALGATRDAARRSFAHHAPVFGAAAAALSLSPDDARRVFLHTTLRSVASAAVRLGVVGPHVAQRLHFELHARLEEVARAAASLSIDDAAVTAPLHELFGATQDRLYSRLFQS